jgi:uncharacterized protein YjdB
MRRAVLVLAATIVLVACGPDVHSLRVEPTEIALNQAGATEQIKAEARDRLGEVPRGVRLTFRSQAPEIAAVSPNGLVTARGHGTTTVVVQAEGTSEMEFVRVVVRIPDRIELRPAITSCNIGGVRLLKAKVVDHNGTVFQNVPIVWSSSDETKAHVSREGEVQGVAEGDVEIFATALGLKTSSKISVIWGPEQRALLAGEKRGGGGGGGKRGGAKGQGQSGAAWDPRLSMWDD